MTGSLEYEKPAVAGALLALYAAGGELPAWAVAGAVVALLGGLCAAETEGLRWVISRRARESINHADERMTG